MNIQKLEIKTARNGRGSFAKSSFRRGEVVWDWSKCRTYTRAQLPVPFVRDEYLQVADNLYVGPDGEPEDAGDFINHSCNPNCEVVVTRDSITLVAICAIGPGQEITYDYGKTMFNDPWKMKCNCGFAKCRKVIHA